MSDPPTPEQARAALEQLVYSGAATPLYKTLADFIAYHAGCHEREATLVLTIEEQQLDLDAAANLAEDVRADDGHHF